MGDDIYTKASLQDLLKYPLSILGIKDDTAPGGKIFKNEKGLFVGLREGAVNVGTGEDFVNCGAYVLDKNIFEIDPVLVKDGEYGLPQTMLAKFQEDKTFIIYVVETKEWINITSPESIDIAEDLLK
jgi:NDP-sugar pyrophosphorylase family protein